MTSDYSFHQLLASCFMVYYSVTYLGTDGQSLGKNVDNSNDSNIFLVQKRQVGVSLTL